MKILKYIIFSLFLLSLVSCDDLLDFPPEDELLKGDAIQNAEDLQQMLNAAYSVTGYHGGRSQDIAEIMTDNLDPRPLADDQLQIFRRVTNFFNPDVDGYYKDPYTTIIRANDVLGNLNEVELQDTDRIRLEAESRFLRGAAHFNIVRMFAQPWGYTADNSHQGISIRLSVSSDAPIRNTVAEVYAQIIEDLQFAADNLTGEHTHYGDVADESIIYATSWAAKAILARVYFQQNDFTNAYALASEVIESGVYTFSSSLNRFGESFSSEVIFGIPSSNINNRGSRLDSYRTDRTTAPSRFVSEDLFNVAASNPSDARSAWYTVLNEENKNYGLTKFDFEFNNVPVIHLTELMFIRAESAASLGTNLDVAIADINQIKGRAGLGLVSSTATVSEILSAIRAERRLEMVGEGDRLHELKRIGALEGATIRGAEWNCPGMILQFPRVEITDSFQGNEEGGC